MPRLTLALLLILASPLIADDRDTLKVGPQPDGRILTPTNQFLSPAGTQVSFFGRPVDFVLIDDGKALVVKNMRDLVVIDVATRKVRQTLVIPPPKAKGARGPGFSAVGIAVAGRRILVTDTQNTLRVARPDSDGKLAWDKEIVLNAPAVKGAVYPTGIAVMGDDCVWVCSSRGNELQLVNLADGKVEASVPVGVSPYLPIIVKDKVYVSNWGGDPPGNDDPKVPTSGTPVRVDPLTSVANHGSVSVVEKAAGDWKQTKTVAVGGHPCGMTAGKDGKFLYVANANSDTVSVIDTGADRVVETIDCKPAARLPFGSGSNAVALSPDGQTLYVANGTNNCVAVVELGSISGGPGAL